MRFFKMRWYGVPRYGSLDCMDCGKKRVSPSKSADGSPSEEQGNVAFRNDTAAEQRCLYDPPGTEAHQRATKMSSFDLAGVLITRAFKQN